MLERCRRFKYVDWPFAKVDAFPACVTHCVVARVHLENGVVGRQPGQYVLQGPVVVRIRGAQEGGVGVDHCGFPGITHHDC